MFRSLFARMLVTISLVLTVSFLILSAVLAGLDRCRDNPVIRILLALLKPVSVTLMAIALWKFCSLSVWSFAGDGGFVFRPFAAALAVFVAVMFVKRKMSIMALIFLCAILGAASAAV